MKIDPRIANAIDELIAKNFLIPDRVESLNATKERAAGYPYVLEIAGKPPVRPDALDNMMKAREVYLDFIYIPDPSSDRCFFCFRSDSDKTAVHNFFIEIGRIKHDIGAQREDKKDN